MQGYFANFGPAELLTIFCKFIFPAAAADPGQKPIDTLCGETPLHLHQRHHHHHHHHRRHHHHQRHHHRCRQHHQCHQHQRHHPPHNQCHLHHYLKEYIDLSVTIISLS